MEIMLINCFSCVTFAIIFQRLKLLLVSVLFFYCWVYIFERVSKIIDGKIYLFTCSRWNLFKDMFLHSWDNFGFPDVSFFNTSATPLITICTYCNFIFVHVCYLIIICGLFFMNSGTLHDLWSFKIRKCREIIKLPRCKWELLATLKMY